MINVCVADVFPVVHFGIKSYFSDHQEIEIVSNVTNFYVVPDALRNKKIDVLLIDLELENLRGIQDLKSLMKRFPETKFVVYTNLNADVYAPNAIKAGVSGFLHKSIKLEQLATSIIKANNGVLQISDDLKKKLLLISKQPKSEKLYRKLSNREIQVLKLLSDGKKNNEISKLLELNEKTISTYKLRLLQKLNVSNLVDLVNKAKVLEIF